MSEDLTNKLPKSDSNNQILTAMNNLDINVQNLRTSFDQLVSWVSSIDSRLKHIEQRVEERLHDTRPIWHKVIADIAHLQEGQDASRAEVRELSSTVRDVNRDQIVINDAMQRVQLDFHRVDERLQRLEHNRNSRNSST